MIRLVIGFIAFLVWSAFSWQWWACHVKQWCSGASTEQVNAATETGRLKSLGLIGKDAGTVFGGFEQFLFAPSTHEPQRSSDNDGFLKKVAERLKSNPSDVLKLTGTYCQDERNASNGFFDNLGTARAASIRDILVNDYGVSTEQVLLENASEMCTGAPASPVRFNLVDGQGLAQTNAGGSFNNMIFSDANFESSSSTLKPTSQFIAYADSLASYTKANPGKKITIVGHTDSDGNDKSNMALGFARAKTTKRYLRDKKGVKATFLESSKGETDPLAPNDSPENKAKNRRIHIIIE